MILYFPMVVFPVSETEGQKICDFIMQGFASEQDARDIYPEAEIHVLEFPDANPLLN